MILYFITEARFHKFNNIIYSQNGSFGPKLWNRYLSFFDELRVVARVEKTDNKFPAEHKAGCKNVSFIELPYYIGPYEYLLRSKKIKKIIRSIIDKKSRYLLRSPGNLSTIAAKILISNNINYALEIVGDPWDVFSSDAKSIFKKIFRFKAFFDQKYISKHSMANLYVSRINLANRYPPSMNCPSFYASNVDIDIKNYISKPRKFNLKNNTINIISIGSLHQLYKSPDVVLKSIKILIEKYQLNVKLTWLGDGKFKPQMIRLANDLGISDKVNFVGNVTSGLSVLNFLNKSHIYVQASRTEGLPRATIEAMSQALPCVGSRVGGIPELIDNEFLVDINNYKMLSQKIKYLITNEQIYESQSIINLNRAKKYSSVVLNKVRSDFLNYIKL